MISHLHKFFLSSSHFCSFSKFLFQSASLNLPVSLRYWAQIGLRSRVPDLRSAPLWITFLDPISGLFSPRVSRSAPFSKKKDPRRRGSYNNERFFSSRIKIKRENQHNSFWLLLSCLKKPRFLHLHLNKMNLVKKTSSQAIAAAAARASPDRRQHSRPAGRLHSTPLLSSF